MQLSPILIALLFAGCASPSRAACDFGVVLGAVLVHNTSSPTEISSETGGSPAVVVVTNLSGILGTTITISSPTLLSYPAGFSAGAATVEHTYSALWTLGSSSNLTYSTQQRSFSVPLAAVVTLTLNHRITSAGGYRQGEYKTRTSITCS